MSDAADGDLHTLHIRCGSDIRDALREAGFGGDFLAFVDPYCQGPLVEDDFLARRIDFVATHYGGERAAVAKRLQGQYAALARAAIDYERVALWFEHDSFDQLILARVLCAFAARQPAGELGLICIDRCAGHERFVGLGQLSPAELASLWPKRVAVEPAHFALARTTWAALLAPQPRALAALAAAPTPPIAPLQHALRRHLMELPWVGDGLSLTQRLTLDALRDGGQTAGAVFRRLARESEPLPHLGDTMFFAVLAQMAVPGAALIAVGDGDDWGSRSVTTTDLGKAVHAGERDWLDADPAPRWLGGVRIDRAHDRWRWCAERGAPRRGSDVAGAAARGE